MRSVAQRISAIIDEVYKEYVDVAAIKRVLTGEDEAAPTLVTLYNAALHLEERVGRAERAEAIARQEVEHRRKPIPMILFCPACHARHVDGEKFTETWHHTHACQGCGFVWRPALVDTIGVQFLPGFKDQ